MAIIASDTGGKNFTPVSAGCHFAICNAVVDLGIQETTFKGQSKSQHQVYIRWEVPDERVTYEKDGKETEGPRAIGATYTLSLGEKANLRKILENWRGQPFTDQELKGFDITTIAGKCCQVMVQHKQGGNGKTYANITGVIAVSKEQRERARKATSEVGVTVYSIDEHDEEMYERLPNWIKEKLDQRVAAPSLHTANDKAPAGEEDFSDEIPF